MTILNDTTMNIYTNLLNNSEITYIVKKIYNEKTDIIIEDKKMRYDITSKNSHITDLYNIDLIFEYIKYDLFINLFYKIKKEINKKELDYSKKIISKYNDVLRSERFRKFYFTLLNINQEVFLQERYLNFITRYFTNNIDKKFSPYNPHVDVIDDLIINYSNVIELFKIQKIVKYVDDCATDICIYSDKIRDGVFVIHPTLIMLYEFENTDIKYINKIVKDNYVLTRIAHNSKFVSRIHIENIIYNNSNCIDTIKASLGDKSIYYNKYVKLIIQSIFMELNY